MAKGAEEQRNVLSNIHLFLAQFFTWIVSILGGLGVALGNVLGMTTMLQSVGMAATQVGFALMHTTSVAVGGLCSGLINFFINLETLESFFKRLFGIKNGADFTDKRAGRVGYWLGIGAFIITGLLFGATAFAFGPIGPLSILSIIAGSLVAIISTIQEMEAWLAGYDRKDPNKPNEDAMPKGTLTSNTIGRVITFGAIIALSLGFTMGIATFLSGVGVPILPSLIVGFGLSFTFGAFTEYQFYDKNLRGFCNSASAKWTAFKTGPKPVLGLVLSSLNGMVNAALAYVAFTMLIALIVSAGAVAPPFGVVLALGIVIGIAAGVGSTLLGISSWPGNVKSIQGLFNKIFNRSAPDVPPANTQGNDNTVSRRNRFEKAPLTRSNSENEVNTEAADLNKSESAPLVDKLKDSSDDKKTIVVIKTANPSLKLASLNMHASKFHHSKASKEQDCTPAPKLSRTAAAAA